MTWRMTLAQGWIQGRDKRAGADASRHRRPRPRASAGHRQSGGRSPWQRWPGCCLRLRCGLLRCRRLAARADQSPPGNPACGGGWRARRLARLSFSLTSSGYCSRSKNGIRNERLGLAVNRDEVRAHGAGFECPFLTVDEERPGIIRIGRCAPGTVLPYGIGNRHTRRWRSGCR